MPRQTTVWDWCNNLQKSVHDLFKSRGSLVDTSTSLLAIQSLREKTPGRRQAELNGLIGSAINGIRDKEEVTISQQLLGVPVGFMPLARLKIGDELKNVDLVIEGLESEDWAVNKRALAAHWFFDGSNTHVDAHDFVHRLLPRVSLRVRRAIARNLSRSLIGHEVKAEQFFEALANVYGNKIGVPILIACSPDYVYRKILEHKIVLSPGVVDRLYTRQPDLAIKYMQLADASDEANADDRRLIDAVRILDYEALVTKLVRKHPEAFVHLYELTPDRSLVLSKTRAAYFLKSLKGTLIDRPKIYLKLLPLKLVSETLSKDEFDRMYGNLFPEDQDDFELDEMIDYLDHYAHGEKIELLKYKYITSYGVAFPLERYVCVTPRLNLVEILPNKERAALAKTVIKNHEDDVEMSRQLRSYLPPDKLLPAFKAGLREMTKEADREAAFATMIVSCKLYESSEHLLEVLEFYYDRHRNERASTLGALFQMLRCHYDEEQPRRSYPHLDERHWHTIMKIVRHVHTKGELFVSTHLAATEWILESALRHYMSHLDTDSCSQITREIVGLLLIIKIEHCFSNWNILKGYHCKLERRALELMLNTAQVVYPDLHEVWKDENKQVTVALDIVQSIEAHNKKNFALTRKIKNNPELRRRHEDAKLKLEAFPWLVGLIERELKCSDNCSSYRRRKLREILEKSFPSFYEAKIGDPLAVQDIESGRALALLRRNPEKIMANWEAYLVQVAKKLSTGSRAAKRFVAATKWHTDLPIKFVERSIALIKERGYVVVLGILLEGDAIVKIVLDTLNLGVKVSVDSNEEGVREKVALTRDILVALKYANPPIQLEHLIHFVDSDFMKNAESTLVSLTHRISAERVSNFARRITSESKKIAAKKLGVRLYGMTAPTEEFFKFLKKLYELETNAGVLFVVTKMILRVFEKAPSLKTWELVRSALRQTDTANRLIDLSELFENLGAVHSNYLSDYVSEYLDTVEGLSSKSLAPSAKNRIVSSLIESLDARRAAFLSESLVVRILNNYFFDFNSPDTSWVVQRFAVSIYLLPTSDATDFRRRLEVVVSHVGSIVALYGKEHTKKPGYYLANESLRKFIVTLLLELAHVKYSTEKILQVIDRFLDLLNKSLEDHQALASRIRLNLYKEFVLADSAQDFGSKSAGCARRFVDEFSELVISDVAKVLNDVINERGKPPSYKFGVIGGLVTGADRVGCLVSIALLNHFKVKTDDERRIRVVELLLQNSGDKVVRAYLDNFMSDSDERPVSEW